ncbi:MULTISPECIES: efflux RND transporter permease subunit [Luteimonas]|uniref:efflux RND transporter permease subunit n=1 Tax=Luteimonas TaxID=83614 RepID=UPI000C7C72DC|nr:MULTISPECIES: efflux RND transporter permease subunit [Luteimonas]
MKMSDVAIKRPVFAVVISLLLVVLGIMSFSRLTLRELPNIDPPIVSVDVAYAGASAAVVETRITQILEDALAGIEGIRTIESRSRNGRADVTIEFNLTRDIEAAANDVRDAISRVMDRLPIEADAPEISKVEADADAIMWLNLRSSTMNTLELTDYTDRYVLDRLSSLDGVARVQLSGSQRYAMRIWLDRDAMTARDVAAADVEAALRNENVELPAGNIESETRDFTLRVERGYREPSQFAQIPIRRGDDGYVVRMGDVARIELGSAERRSYTRSNSVPNVGLGIVRTSTANALDVARAAREEAERIQETLPDGTDWLFLGSLRAAIIPAVTAPVCLIAAFTALYMFGFSVNLLTLLALVLCIGLVVDDAIIVLENVQRRADLGEPPLVAARRGTAQVAFAVIATTAVLVAVFLPVGFMEGNSGRLFRELSVTLAGAVALSAFIALTLTPMMCSKLVRRHEKPRGFNKWMTRQLDRLSSSYGGRVSALVGMRSSRLILAMALAMGACVVVALLLFWRVPSELSPAEDRGRFFVSVDGPEGAGFDYTVDQMQQVEAIFAPLVGDDRPIERANSRVPRGWGGSEEMHNGQVIVFLQDWRDREVATTEIVEDLRAKFAELTGVQVRANVPGGLISSRGQRYQLVLGGPDYAEIAIWRDRMLARMRDNPGIQDPDSDYKETRPQMRVDIDRPRAADLGVSVQEIGRTLETMMGSRQVTTFVDNGEEYDVLLQADRERRMTPSDLTDTFVRGRDGALVPLSNLVTLSEVAEPGSFNRFNRLRAITISAGLAPGYTMGEAIEWTRQVASEELPDYAQVDWKGESREFQEAGGAVLLTFAMALLIVYLVLAAQFESFVHPLSIMLTVPLAVLGALIGLWATGGTLNLFSQIGIVMLIGLAAKNGILIVEFANQLRDDGRSVRDAITEAAAVRLRPILMTAAATMVGAVPLVVAGGPGSASRATIGVVIIFGVGFSTLLSLFVVPAFYALLAPFTRSPEALAHELERLESETPAVSGHA